MQRVSKTFLALDVGEKRIGIARGRSDVRLASPLTTIANDEHVWEHLQDLVDADEVDTLIVGLPRGLDGQTTTQTQTVEAFVSELQRHIPVAVHFQDEALTSRKAESELAQRGRAYAKGEVDALAATYILEDYLNTLGGAYV